MKSSIQSPDSGFTLVELLVAMTLGLLLLSLLTSVFLLQKKTYNAELERSEMVQTARGAMDLISRELRMAGYDPSRAGIQGVLLDTSKLEIRADLNGDGDVNDTNEKISYRKDPGANKIYRTVGSLTQTLEENIKSFVFEYLKSDGTAATQEADIRQVCIAITAITGKPDKRYKQNSGYRTQALVSRITPMNLGL